MDVARVTIKTTCFPSSEKGITMMQSYTEASTPSRKLVSTNHELYFTSLRVNNQVVKCHMA